jgi:ATP-dependent helicase/nuclease subunit A
MDSDNEPGTHAAVGGGLRGDDDLESQWRDGTAARVLGGVVAITFTEAAAAEMAARVAEALAQVERGQWPRGVMPGALPRKAALRRGRARALLGSLDHLVVMTIHAFCFRLLTRFPMEAGLHPLIRVDAEGAVLEEVIREVLEDEIRGAYGEPGDPHFLFLAARGEGPRELGKALIRLASQAVPEEALADDPFSRERMGALRDELLERARAVESAGASRLVTIRGKGSVGRELAERICQTRGRLEATAELGRPQLEDLCAWLKDAWTESHWKRLREWGKGEFNKSEATAIGESGEPLAKSVGPFLRILEHVARLDPALLDHARLALGPLLARVNSQMHARGVQTFAGLLRDAQDLLRRHPAVLRAVRRSMDQLLVDEFQDTDPVQCDIVRMLALDGPADERPGLFLVGDPKQSIYGWRNADLEAYDDFVAEVLNQGGRRDPLAVNFRSVPAILQEVERVIRPVMKPERGLQPAFQPLLPCPERAGDRGFEAGPRAPVEYWVSWARDGDGGMLVDRTRSDQAAELEAAAVARDILALHHEHQVPWQEVGVLLRSTGDLDTYLAAFREAEIPYAVARDRSYYRRREVIEAAALVRCVLDPHDHVALLTYLRSAWVGVPDAAWIPLWSRSFPERFTGIQAEDPRALALVRSAIEEALAEIPAEAPGIEGVAGWERSLLAAARHIGILRESFRSEPVDRFVARLRRLCLAEVTESARYLGPYRLANLERFFRHLTRSLDEGAGDTQAVLRGLRTGVVQALEAEEGRPKEAAEEAVQVMTIHKAKGLDFRHMYLVQIHKGTPGAEAGRMGVSWLDGRWEYMLLGAPTPGFLHLLERDRAVAEAELVRTLYVAMTRAKDRLVLAGRWPDRGGGSRLAGAHVGLIEGRAPGSPSLRDMMEAAAAGGAIHADGAGTRWVFPGLLGADRPTPVAPRKGPVLPAPEEVRRDGEILARRARAAHALMARPFSQAASQSSHEALREMAADGVEQGAPWAGHPDMGHTPAGAGGEQQMAMAAGSAVHRALEYFDLHADPDSEWRRQLTMLERYVEPALTRDERAGALARARALLQRFARGPLFPRFLALRDRVIARELPVLMPAQEGGSGPVGFISGTVDLLYWDPETGQPVVADYKTDHVEGPREVALRAGAYAPQGGVYAEAVMSALGLAALPRIEFWFLHPGRIVSP